MRRLLVLCFAIVLVAAPASGTPFSGLYPSVEAGFPGSEVFYSGLFQNTGASDLFLNDFSVSFVVPGGVYLMSDSNFFFANVPGTYLPTEFYTGPILGITIAPGTPVGAYFGTLTLLGGGDEFALNDLGSANFELDVVPEPASLVLLATGLAGLFAYRRCVRPFRSW